MKIIAYGLLGMLMALFGVGVTEQPIGFFSIFACVLLIDFIKE